MIEKKPWLARLGESLRRQPLNPALILLVAGAYWVNNRYLKSAFTGAARLFFVGYFNDLICPLLFFGYANLLLLTVGKELRQFRRLLLLGLCVSAVWEGLAPLVKPGAVADPLDVACYLAGSAAYGGLLRLAQARQAKKAGDPRAASPTHPKSL